MRLVMLDRDGVITVNREHGIRSPPEVELIKGAAEAISRLNRAGIKVAVCTNQPEVEEGVITERQLAEVHKAMRRQLADRGARLDLIFCCTRDHKSPSRKPGPVMLIDALRKFGARPAATPFVGDQVTDLVAAARARCPRVLVKTGLGKETLTDGLPNTVQPVEICEDLGDFVDRFLSCRPRRRGADL
jgi:D-glycero-D-manno-heptose 1,7-bisphosphate phosphatase